MRISDWSSDVCSSDLGKGLTTAHLSRGYSGNSGNQGLRDTGGEIRHLRHGKRVTHERYILDFRRAISDLGDDGIRGARRKAVFYLLHLCANLGHRPIGIRIEAELGLCMDLDRISVV